VLVAAVTVRTEVPLVVNELGVNVAERPGTSDTPSRVRLTVPVKFSGVRVRV
jgi:hypothetical protein